MTIKTANITVTNTGTPVRVTTDPDVAWRIVIAAKPNNTQRIYVGLAGMNKATLSQIIHRPLTATGGEIELRSRDGAGNELRPSDLYIDADVNGEGALVTWYIA